VVLLWSPFGGNGCYCFKAFALRSCGNEVIYFDVCLCLFTWYNSKKAPSGFVESGVGELLSLSVGSALGYNRTLHEDATRASTHGASVTRCNVYRIGQCFEQGAGIATGYGLDDRGVGVRVPVGSRIFTSPRRPDRLWGPPSLVSNGYWG
jgi:hypothetical protein